MKTTFMLACLLCVLFITANFANKYVLSVLGFTYPTIFQGWQTLVGVVMFKALISTGHIENLLQGKDWYDCAVWLPGMMCFLISIYSGSRAMASLPIPVFLVLHNFTLVFKASIDLIFYRQITPMYSYFMLMMSVSSGIAVAKTDPQYDQDGYFWMCVHVVCLGISDIYTSLMRNHLDLSLLLFLIFVIVFYRPTERLFCCYFYSVLLLAPCSYFLGDALSIANFPFFYFAKFYLGCILSGVLGMLLNLCTIRLHELKPTDSLLNVNAVQGLAKILCSCASLGFYEIEMTHSFVCFIAINLICSFGFWEGSKRRKSQVLQTDYNKQNTNQNSEVNFLSGQQGSLFLKRHELQQDMLRVEMGQ